MSAARAGAVAAVAAMAAAGCVPDIPDDTSIVRAPRLVAARAEPAEARPGSTMTTTGLWIGPDGPIADAPLAWAFCTVRKAFTEPGPVAPACLAVEAPELVAFGTGATATGALPDQGCRRFGPDRPDPVPGETAGRPADPDGTGGYYQPVRVHAGDAGVSLVQLRIACGLPEATPEQTMHYLRDYVANANPAITAAALARGGGADEPLVPLEDDPAAAPARVAPGETVELTVRWPACDAAPCGGAEPYLWFDPRARVLAPRREAMRVSWLATAGAFAIGHSGRTEDETTAGLADARERWTAPAEPGAVHVWAVLRDDRGGATWATFRVDVAP